MTGQKIMKICLGFVFCVLLMPSLASAKDVGPSLFEVSKDEPDVNEIPLFRKIVDQGGKLYYMGARSGLDGWFVLKDGRIQMFYVTPDKKSLMLGSLFTADGHNVTTPQIVGLIDSNKEVATMMADAAKQQKEVRQAGASQDGVASLPSHGAAVRGALPSATLSPGDQLVMDLQAAAGVTLGDPSTPEILMVSSPNCPHCKQTWEELRKHVFDKKLHVRLVPINDLTPEDVEAAAMLLAVAEPLVAWDKYVSGEKGSLKGQPTADQLQAVQANQGLMDKWKIRATPYIVYRNKEGRVKIVIGKPDRMAALLTDLPQNPK